MPKSHPNVLVFIMDDQRADTIRTLGNACISTPVLDELADGGVFFRPYTTVPVCTPGRAEFLTGRTAFHNGCRWFGEPILPEIELLPQALRRIGYHCCHIGKWHNDGHPRDRGYHETHFVFGQDLVGGYRGHDMTFDSDGIRICGHSTELFCGEAVQFMGRAPQDQPWFCYVALHSPHDPRTAPEPWASMYTGAMQPPLPENFMPEHPFDNGDMMIRDERLAGFPRRQGEIRRHVGDYYSMISHHDHYIGQVLHALRASGQYDDTLIVFTSDHGLAVGSHGLMGKENIYEHSARVPLIIRGPGIPEGKRFDRTCLCGHYDFIPTLFELLGVAPPATAEGISYASVIRGETDTVRDTICAGYRDCMRTARDSRFKMLWYPHIGRTQLFDIEADPEETNDLMTPWRRYRESRCCPPPRPLPYGPDPAFKDVMPPEIPPYVPPIEADEADRVVDRLRHVLSDWQDEMGDPVARADA